ncbi:MAG TPA: MFS transporter [Rhodobacteraceae bacterium]|jgi:BCD family chlorophyll transporter-like MFS transporter|nr:MFS transporter [Paracoccaceae bacterium]HBV55549.1 MFS transporter [Paracoccaceae bacterium]
MTLNWFQIFRLGLVQMCLGAIVVLTTSTLNRLMAVELSLPAVLPGALVALHYGIQISRPAWGFRSDTQGNRTRFIVLGMAVLGAGALLASYAITVIDAAFWTGLLLSILAYSLIGLGVGASGTSLLALVATATAPRRRAAAATITWLMMIFGIALTAASVGILLDPYSGARLLMITAGLVTLALVLTLVAVMGIERQVIAVPAQNAPTPLLVGLKEVWAERRARDFTIFVFLSMVAYFLQELILEPYAGLVFGLTPGQSTQLSGAQNGGVFLGMLTVGAALSGFRIGTLRGWIVAGCLGSAAALGVIAQQGMVQGPYLTPSVVMLGVFNGVFAVSAIGAMMSLAGEGRQAREGTRMGLWGAAQALAAGFGGLLGTAAVDILRLFLADAPAFGAVFLVEAMLFVMAAALAMQVISSAPVGRRMPDVRGAKHEI